MKLCEISKTQMIQMTHVTHVTFLVPSKKTLSNFYLFVYDPCAVLMCLCVVIDQTVYWLLVLFILFVLASIITTSVIEWLGNTVIYQRDNTTRY